MRPFHLAVMAAFISGFSIYANKLLLAGQDSLTMTFAKMAMAAAIILAVRRGTVTRAAVSMRKLSLLMAVGLIGGCIPFLLFFYALSMTSAASASFIHKTMFVFASLLSYVFLRERVSNSKALAMLLAFSGVAFLSGLAGLSFGYYDLLILIATLFWAAEQVVSKRLLRDTHPDILASARLGFGSLFVLAFLAFRGFGNVSILPVMASSILLAAYVSTWYRGLQNLSVSTATTILLLGSVVTTFLQMDLSLYALIGSALVAAALIPAGREAEA